MRKFIINVVVVAISVIALDYCIGTFLDRTFSLNAFKPASKAYRNCYELVMLGPSEMNNQYVSNMIADSLGLSVYNYGAGGQNIYYQYITLNLMINHSTQKPKIVLWEPSSIDFYDIPNWNTEKLNCFYPMYEFDDSLQSVVNLQGWQDELLLRTLKCYKHNSNLLGYLKDIIDKDTDDNNGFVPVDPVVFDDVLETVGDAGDEKIDIQKIEYIRRFITLCKNNNIQLIVVNAPYYEKHNSLLWMDTLNNVLQEEGIPFLNYDNNPYFTSHREWFYNRVHFNKYGAVEYTKYIVPDLKKIVKN